MAERKTREATSVTSVASGKVNISHATPGRIAAWALRVKEGRAELSSLDPPAFRDEVKKLLSRPRDELHRIAKGMAKSK